MEVYLPEGVILNYKITACEQVSTNSAVYKITEEGHECTFRINGAPFPRQRCKRLAPAVRYPFVVTC